MMNAIPPSGQTGLAAARQVILGATEILRPPLAPEIHLYLSGDPVALWERLGGATAPQERFPFWSVAWAGGQAIARYLLDHPGEIVDRRVLDFGSGSGMCAIAAAKAGARAPIAADIDPISREAIRANGELSGVTVAVCEADVTRGQPPEVDVILAGDVCYERDMSAALLPWLRRMHREGIRVLVGDPGREYFPCAEFTYIAQYDVSTSLDIEGVERKHTGVYAFRD
jgi:predicted nicotinamide N-methyase